MADTPFVAGFMSYNLAWVRALYHVRGWLVRVLGMRQDGVPQGGRILDANDVPMRAGQKISFFPVAAAEAGHYRIAKAEDTHLDAILAIERSGENSVYRVCTIVHYKSWAGPVYFNVIRRFHHRVVCGMARADARVRGRELPGR
jgi:hypothetical protein